VPDAPTDYIRENEAARTDLIRVVASLSDADLGHPTHSGWTVAATLAHLAYWDRRYRLILERWERGEVATSEEPDWADDVTNDALLPEWLALPPREACRLALEAADAVDSLVASLSPGTVAGVMQARRRWLLHRHGHRREHLAEIARALGSR
jgi:hypothetical protein